MSYVIINAYKDAWKTGEQITLWVQHFTEADNSKDTISNAGTLTIIDPLCTIVAAYSTYSTIKDNMGFTNVIPTSLNTTDTYYVSEKNYFTVKGGTGSRPYDITVSYYINGEYWTGSTVHDGAWLQNYVGEDDPLITGTTGVSISGNTMKVSNSYVVTTDTRCREFWAGSEIYEFDDDPYKEGGNSGTGGGTGTFSGTGDSIDFPSLPTLSAVSTGFITLFNPSIAQMQSLATYMWSDVFDIGLYKTLFADPMDCILGCSIVPVAVPNGGTKTVNVGNVSTGISMTVAASQYVEVDCGTLNVEEYWGSYLDYDPYTKAEIYLPYCGTHALQVDDIMGKAVHVKYHVDILSGACCAYVKCGSSVMYSFVGQCSSSIPISANDWTNVVNGALTIAASVGSLIATGGASAPMAVGAAAAVTGTIYGGGIKQNVEKSGSMGGTGGMLAVQTPYIILTRPRQALPKKQNTYTGYPSFITTKLSDLKGYTEIDSIRITGVPATDAELNELESILKSGVIF